MRDSEVVWVIVAILFAAAAVAFRVWTYCTYYQPLGIPWWGMH